MLVAKSEFSYYPEEVLETKENKIKKSKTKKKSSNSTTKLFFIGISIMFLSVSLFILFRYAKITAIRTEITQLERQQVELEKTKQDLIAELEGIKSSSKIEEDALYKLGMNYPSGEQIVYLNVDSTINNYTTEKAGITHKLKKVFSMVSSLF